MLSKYQNMWKKDIGSEIRKQAILRKIYRKMSNKDIDHLFEEFGPHIEELRNFKYDKITESWRIIPKMKLFKFFLSNLPILISRSYV